MGEPGKDAARNEPVQALLEKWFLFVRTVLLYGPDHPITAKMAAGIVRAVADAQPPLAIQFVGQGVFCNFQLLLLDVEAFLHAQEIGIALANLGQQEIVFEAVPTQSSVISLAVAMARGLKARCDALHGRPIEGFRWREIKGAVGFAMEAVDLDLLVLTHLTLALADADQLQEGKDKPWDWFSGMAIIRRLEASLGTTRATAHRLIEIIPGDWTPRRLATTACMDAISLMNSLDVGPQSRRAAAHATLALTWYGLTEHGGAPIASFCGHALRRLMTAHLGMRAVVEPHRLKTMALIHLFERSGGDPKNNGLLRVIDLAYEMARKRAPADVPFTLSRADLLAQIAREAGERFPPRWVSVAVTNFGIAPPGALVRLADGRTGMVMEPAEDGDPWRPKVLVNGVMVQPDRPVTLVVAGGTAKPPPRQPPRR
jgi:hypothetical protein